MTDYEIGDDEYEETEEVNTSYDQNQPIGDEPQALNTELSNSEPIDAETGEDFYTIQTGGQSPKIGEFQSIWKQLGYESLNLDGTGMARATRGVNPNKTPQKLLTFVYVSKADCPICKQYDGQTWVVDSPNRPIIPRLEGKHGSRPFTHPHCKCKWVNVFLTKDEGSIDTPQTLGSTEVNQADFDRTRKWYGAGFDELNVIQQKMAMIDMLKQSLGMEVDENDKPLNEYTKDDSYRSECQICGAPLEEHPITEGNDPHEWLAEQPADWEGDMSPANEDIYDNAWDGLDDEQKRMYNTLDDVESEGGINKTEYLQIANAVGVKREALEADPIYNYYCPKCNELIGDEYDAEEHEQLHPDYPVEKLANEGGRGSGRVGHQKWMLAGEAGEECPNCMMITEKENGKCVICGK